MPDEQLSDRIYEAAIVPERWPDVLEGVCEASASFGGVLFAANPDYSGWVASPRLAPLFAEFVAEGWTDRNPRPGRAIASKRFGFIGDHELFSLEEMDADPTYAYLRGKGLGWCAGQVAPLPTGDTLIFSWERRYADGPFPREQLDKLDSISGHLMRAALVAGRLGLEKARAATETMQALGLPAAALSRGKRLLLANALFEPFVPRLVQDRRERAAITDLRADGLFAQALIRICAGAVSHVQSIPVAAAHERPPMVLHILPVRRSAQDIFSAAAALLVITEVSQNAARRSPDARVIQGLFDLTPTEAIIAQAIAEGREIAEIASSRGVSRETIRTHLKSIFAKTGASRQADVVRLLSGVTIAR